MDHIHTSLLELLPIRLISWRNLSEKDSFLHEKRPIKNITPVYDEHMIREFELQKKWKISFLIRINMIDAIGESYMQSAGYSYIFLCL